MRLIEKEWQLFREMVIDQDASPLQLEEMRRAFYSGAGVMFKTLYEKICSETTRGDGDFFEAVEEEVNTFAQAQIDRDSRRSGH